MAVKPIPQGYHSVTPYLTVANAAALLEFLQRAFGAEVTEKMQGPDGKVAHAAVRIGDSMVMLGEAPDPSKVRPSNLCLYVPDADAVYARALAAGGVSDRPVELQFYGDRSGGVRDPAGNGWWISTHVEDVPPAELERRMKEFAQKK